MKQNLIEILCVLTVLTTLSCTTVVKQDIVIEKTIKAKGKSASQIFENIELWLFAEENQTSEEQAITIKYSNKTSNRVVVNVDERIGKVKKSQALSVHYKIAMEAQEGNLKMRLTFLGTSSVNSEDADASEQEYPQSYPRGYGVRKQKIRRQAKKLIAEIKNVIR